MRIEKFTVGADPELFIVNANEDDTVSAIGLIPGKKGAPYRTADMPEGFGMETDNILAEFNIPPVTDDVHFVHHIEYMKNYIRDWVRKKNEVYDIMCVASREVRRKYLQTKEAQEIGCAVDLNAYTGGENPKIDAYDSNLRVSGL